MEKIDIINFSRAMLGIFLMTWWCLWCCDNNYLITSNLDKFILILGVTKAKKLRKRRYIILNELVRLNLKSFSDFTNEVNRR